MTIADRAMMMQGLIEEKPDQSYWDTIVFDFLSDVLEECQKTDKLKYYLREIFQKIGKENVVITDQAIRDIQNLLEDGGVTDGEAKEVR